MMRCFLNVRAAAQTSYCAKLAPELVFDRQGVVAGIAGTRGRGG